MSKAPFKYFESVLLDECGLEPWGFFFKDFICLLFRDRGREGEREGDKHPCVRDTLISCFSREPNWGTWATTQACALTGNRTCDLLVCRKVLNALIHTSQGKPWASLASWCIYLSPEVSFSLSNPIRQTISKSHQLCFQTSRYITSH